MQLPVTHGYFIDRWPPADEVITTAAKEEVEWRSTGSNEETIEMDGWMDASLRREPLTLMCLLPLPWQQKFSHQSHDDLFPKSLTQTKLYKSQFKGLHLTYEGIPDVS